MSSSYNANKRVKNQTGSWKVVVGLCVSIDYIITCESLEIRLVAKCQLMEHTKTHCKEQTTAHF